MRTFLLPAIVAVSAVVLAQQPPRATQPPAPVEEAAPEPPARLDSMQEIDIDNECRFAMQDRRGENGTYSTPHLGQDAHICHLESVRTTRGHEDIMSPDGILQRTAVTIKECTYVLHNIASNPVVFVVHHPLHDGWRIDSDPQPYLIADGLASFRVVVQPDETVHLHVGERR